ncbi:Superfamily II DNA or RNA helicase, SNF2 family [Haloplanus vescus]|uniref:Superfamily II DNA or RNA helicase, SNF2 family n=1 Tax=Haloplanus vescus TaxID=555874 RepID=A0A1H3ZYH0_9EURY|nr:DEAD/DEAH box helicase [Haloplanus vescus]SEA26886.1 Superfamily II DNA or RNA helicase, SNF2 family [Haloplanus vescus]SEA28813.1 Superfamily II DNA or RNA helicase, SNF2 family [Haloplanus vescus]
MFILHAVTDDCGKIYLWAEDSTLPRLRTKEQDSKGGERHPFAVDKQTLNDILSYAGYGNANTEMITLTVYLPSGQDNPQPSPSIREENAQETTTSLAPWLIPAVEVDPRDAPLILSYLSQPSSTDKETISHGENLIKSGRTVKYWSSVCSVAESYVESGRVVPHLAEKDGSVTGVWRAYPSREADIDLITELMEAMPPLARTSVGIGSKPILNRGSPNDPIGRSSRDVLTRALDQVVNALSKERLSPTETDLATDKVESAHQQWIRTLQRTGEPIDAAPEAIAELRDQLDEWTRPPVTGDEQEVRLCFQLKEPEVETDMLISESETEPVVPDGWMLELLLQSEDDPSLVVEASELWNSDRSTSKILARHLNQPTEILKNELERASPLYPRLKEELDQSKPTAIELSNSDAAEFLQEYAEVLRQAGFGVILPNWWGEPPQRLGARLVVSDADDEFETTGSGLGIEQLCEFDWEIVLGENSLSEDELEELSTLKQSLVHFQGKWVSVQDDDAKSARDLLHREEERTLEEALQADTEISDDGVSLPVVEKRLEGTFKKLFEQDFEIWAEKIDTPSGFDGELRSYQKTGLGWISYLEDHGFGGCLADDMGLGKTIQILARLVQERSVDPLVGPTLVVCPLSVVYNWKSEANKFTPDLTVHIHHGQGRMSGGDLASAIQHHDVIITTYGTARSDIELLRDIQFHRIVLDEAQKIKNTSASRTQAIRSLSAHHRLALTGTPVENRLSELWSIMEFCNPGLLGTESQFRNAFSRPIEEQGDIEKMEQLRQLIRPFVLRREKTDNSIIDDLPEKLEKKEYCGLTEEQATLYKAVADEIFEQIEQSQDIERRGRILKLIGNLKSICNHPRQYLNDDQRISGRSGKLDVLDDLVQKIGANDEKGLIFTQYTQMAELLLEHLRGQGHRVFYLYGGTAKEEREEMIDEFENTEGSCFFLLSLHAGGTGINLTPANYVIHYDRWWNPAVEKQATDRAYRIGQDNNVQVHKLICRGTIEESIDQIIESKRDLAEQVLADSDEWITELSDEELRNLVSLSADSLV